jgi:hypothetical protein
MLGQKIKIDLFDVRDPTCQICPYLIVFSALLDFKNFLLLSGK